MPLHYLEKIAIPQVRRRRLFENGNLKWKQVSTLREEGEEILAASALNTNVHTKANFC